MEASQDNARTLRIAIMVTLQQVSENDLYSLKQSAVVSVYAGTVTLFGIFILVCLSAK